MEVRGQSLVPPSYRQLRCAARGPGCWARGLPLARLPTVLVLQVLRHGVLPQLQRPLGALAAGAAGPVAPRAPQTHQAVAGEAVAAGQRGGPGQQLVTDDAAQVVLGQPHGDGRAGVQARPGPQAAAAPPTPGVGARKSGLRRGPPALRLRLLLLLPRSPCPLLLRCSLGPPLFPFFQSFCKLIYALGNALAPGR